MMRCLRGTVGWSPGSIYQHVAVEPVPPDILLQAEPGIDQPLLVLADQSKNALLVPLPELARPTERDFVLEPDFRFPPAVPHQHARRLPEFLGIDQKLKVVLLHYEYVHDALP